MSAQLPPEVEAIVTTATDAAVDLVLGALPPRVRGELEALPGYDVARGALATQLARWARALVADVLAPPVRVEARDGADVRVTVE